MDVDDLDRGIVFEVFTQFGDVNVHASCIEVVVVDPNCFQSEISFENLVYMGAKEAQPFRLFGGELRAIVVDG